MLPKFLAIDTEANGLTPHHGCRAFAVSACNVKGATSYYDTVVDPKTREVHWNKLVAKRILNQILSYDHLVFHNIRFDMRMLWYLFRDQSKVMADAFIHHLELLAELHQLHCTMTRTHVLNSKAPKGLKAQGVLNLGILDDDEKDLDTAIKHLRLKVKKDFGWRIAEEGLPELGGMNKQYHKADMWLPKAYAKKLLLPKSHEYWNVCETYAVKDAVRTAGLFIAQENTFKKYPELLKPYRLQQDCIFPIFDMENEGITVLVDRVQSELQDVKNIRKAHQTTMKRIVKRDFGIEHFNPNSHLQLKEVLFQKFRLKPVSFTNKNSPSTDKNALPLLALQAKKQAAKVFMNSLIGDREVGASERYLESYNRHRIGPKLYPNINTEGTSTTRTSSDNPNGQNIGKGKEQEGYDEDGNLVRTISHSIRRVFGPLPGDHWLAVDYDQLQIRIFAYWSKEPKLIEAIESGFDFHDFVAKMIFEVPEVTKAQRKVAKYVNFGIIFGAGAGKIDSMCGIPGTHAKVLKIFPNVADSLARTGSFVRRHGYVLTASGYRLIVPRNKPYAGVNYIVQGTEGDIVKKAIADCHKIIKPTKTRMMLPVHDEILFRFPIRSTPPLLALTQAMEEAGSYYGVQCKAKSELITTDWASGQSIPNNYYSMIDRNHRLRL